jgi:hypothetical protein
MGCIDLKGHKGSTSAQAHGHVGPQRGASVHEGARHPKDAKVREGDGWSPYKNVRWMSQGGDRE